MVAKEVQAHGRLAALARVERPDASDRGVTSQVMDFSGVSDPLVNAARPATPAASDLRWFNGRLVRPARRVTMMVTAYSPDERSCGDSADGITSSLHSVETNNGRLVAADPSVLPLGSIISVPGYADGQVVPVLDKGGKIKGNHIDLLYPTDQVARQWGVQHLTVTVWEYADGKPAPD